MTIEFPDWVKVTPCDTYTLLIIDRTKHGVVRRETVWLTPVGWEKFDAGLEINRESFSLNYF